MSFLLLLPGLNQHGIITKYTSMAKREINKLMKHKEKKNEWVGQKCRSREQIREQPHHQMTGGRKLEKRRQSVSWVCCLFRVFFFLYRWTWHFSTSVFYFLHESVLPAASIENLTSILSSVIYSFTCSTDHCLCTYGPQLSFNFIFCQWWFESHHRVTTE